MLKFTRTLFELVLLVFALNVIYDHVHHAWLNQSIGWYNSISQEWRIASEPMLIAIGIVILVLAIELLFVFAESREQRKRDRERKRREAVLLSIAEKFGVTEIDIQKQEELLYKSSKHERTPAKEIRLNMEARDGKPNEPNDTTKQSKL